MLEKLVQILANWNGAVVEGNIEQERIRFNIRVKSVKKADGIWLVELEGGPKPLRAARIIDASGITTEPELPDIPKLQKFKGIQMHMKALARSNPYSNANCSRIAVIGGAKSAADAAYSAAQAGKTVYWIIRKSGNGPCWHSPAHTNPPFKSPDEPLLSRILFYILSSQFVKDTFVVRLLNRTAIGRSIIRFRWRNIEGEFRKRANYSRPDPKDNGFKQLEPDTLLYWANDNTGEYVSASAYILLYFPNIALVTPNFLRQTNRHYAGPKQGGHRVFPGACQAVGNSGVFELSSIAIEAIRNPASRSFIWLISRGL
jgi:hypothetical protein